MIKTNVSFWRQIAASFIGALSSLVMFLPKISTFTQVSFSLFVCLLMSLFCFGIKNVKQFFRACAVMFGVIFGYAGGMLFIWLIFKPNGMIIHNSIVYFNISPIFLVVFSVIAYLIIVTLKNILARNANTAKRCTIVLQFDNNSITLTAIADSGNSLKDVFGMSEIIIVEKKSAELLFGELNSPSLQNRYRAIPCNTVSGCELLDAYRGDSAFIEYENKSIELIKPILAISKTELGKDYSAIINPEILL